ncbi:MAG: YqiA/YcfP family alpha/beta fold hydrolase [Pseudomonadota bacterium]
MPALLYAHGFLSSPMSYKAQQVKHWLEQHRPDIDFICPQLPPYPKECANILESIVDNANTHNQALYAIGSSMGGFWCTWLVEKYDLKALVINPGVDVLGLMPAYLNQDLRNYHSDEKYCLTDEHLSALANYNLHPLTRLSRYWLLVQTGDETLDYRLAVEKYQGCRQTVEQGGDHSFQGFGRYIPEAIEFFESP